METTADQACENDNKYIQLAPESDFSQNPSKSTNLWKPFFGAILAFLISYVAFFFFSETSLPFSLPIFLLAKPEGFNVETYLNRISDLSIQLDRRVIQVSSPKEQIFPLLVSQNIQIPDPLPIDLICVFDFSENHMNHKKQVKYVRSLFKEFLPLMTDQDRLSVVLLDGIRDRSPILNGVPFTETTKENRERIISSIGENILRGETSVVEGRVNILEQRNGSNQATGIFLFSKTKLALKWGYAYKDQLGLQNVDTTMTRRSNSPKELGEDFKKSFAILRNDVVKTQLVIRPEESQLFKGVEIINEYQEWTHISCGGPMTWSPRVDGSYQDASNWLPLGMKEFVFDLKIPKITEPLPLSPMEVKIASCQLIFHLSNGSQVVRNVDLMVKVVGEGEGFVHEEGSPEVMRNFYSKWGDRLLSRAPYFDAAKPKEMLKRFQESLEKSAVKDDKQLRKRVKDTETTIAWIEFDESSL